MKKTEITNGIVYVEVPEVNLRILCGCPENSIKFIMKEGLTPSVEINGFKLVGGPNSILLNDLSIKNSHFLNFSEFPVLHHQYFQGAAFNGTNEKFILIGNKEKINNQYNYIRRGFHGLTSKDEILEAGVDEDVADKCLAINNYHRGKEKKFDIIDKLFINGKTRIKDDLYIKRISINIFEFTYLDETILVDLNLNISSKGVGLPYSIDHKLVEFDDFSITTIGDGNGWNPIVPCMGSLITAKGKRFLVDSGPGSLDLLRHLGVTSSEIEGVFVTHSHDDHFAGLLSLLNSDSKIKFFASAIVIISVEKKLEALLNISKEELKRYIDFIVLKEGIWTNIGEMEVKPKYSFHTIETNVFYFRSMNENNEWKSYGHITDIISRKDLDYMLENDSSGIITNDWADSWFNNYFETSDLKRIDAGGGVVHGCAEDFIEDNSSKIILSHLNNKIDSSGSNNFIPPTEFGHTEVLIQSNKNYLLEKAEMMLSELNFFEKDQKKYLLEEDIILSKPGEVVLSKGDKIKSVFMVLSGLIEADDNKGYKRKYVKGDFLYSFNNEKSNNYNYISNSYCYLLKLDLKKVSRFIKRINPNYIFKVLRNSTFFSYGLSLVKLLELSTIVEVKKAKKNKTLTTLDYNFFIVIDGEIESKYDLKSIRIYKKNEISIIENDSLSIYTAKENSLIIFFRDKDIYNFPSLLWSCYEEAKHSETIVETRII